jgi:hypothetical protein
MRLPQVHDTVKQGLVTYLIAIAREKGISAYIGDGLNRWPAVHVLDGRSTGWSSRTVQREPVYNAVAEEGVPLREIAEAIGRGLKLPVVSLSPEQADEHFGWLAGFVGFDIPASSALTQKDWDGARRVRGCSDLDRARYFEA